MLTRTVLLLLFFVLLVRAVWRLVQGVARGASGEATRRGGRAPSQPAVKMAQCPVCGTYVVPGKAISDVSRGHTIFFCSETCRAKHVA